MQPLTRKVKKAFSYARTATWTQADDKNSNQAQLKAIREYAKSNGYQIMCEFIDEAERGDTIDRPALKEMIAMAKARPGDVDAILVQGFSRFARKVDIAVSSMACLKNRGIDVISIDEPIDDSLQEILLRQMLVAIDGCVWRAVSEVIIRGMKENASRGGWNGGNPPLGYNRVKVQTGSEELTTLMIDKEYGPVIERIFYMCLEGKAPGEIAKKLNLEGISTGRGGPWTSTTIRRVLMNEAYSGTLVWNQTHRRNGKRTSSEPTDVVRRTDNHPAIVDAGVFELVQRRLKEGQGKG